MDGGSLEIPAQRRSREGQDCRSPTGGDDHDTEVDSPTIAHGQLDTLVELPGGEGKEMKSVKREDLKGSVLTIYTS